MEKQKRLILTIAVLFGLALVLLIGAWIVGRSPLVGQLSRLSALQQEILRVNDLTEKFHPDPALTQDMANVTALITSDNVQISTQLKDLNGNKALDKAIIQQETVSDAESRLSSASNRNELANEYDNIITKLLDQISQLAADAQHNTKKSDLIKLLQAIQFNCADLKTQLNQ